MKVKDLMHLLADMDGESLVIVQKDAEGNGFSPLQGVDHGHYDDDPTYGGDVYNEALEDSTPCVVLYPVN
jgi:hypothetical protein